MKIYCLISQGAAIKVGSNSYGYLSTEVDVANLSEDQRGLLADLLRDMTGRTYTDDGRVYLRMGEHGLATEEAVIWRLNEFLQEDSLAREKTKEEYEEAVAALLAVPQKDFNSFTSWGLYSPKYISGTVVEEVLAVSGFSREERRGGYHGDPRLAERMAARWAWQDEEKKRQAIEKAEADRLRTENEARQEAANEAKRLQDEARVTEKKAQIVAWVGAKGTESQQKRLAAGLLSDQEIIDALRDEAFLSLVDFSLYEPLKAADVCTCEDTYDGRHCHVDFESCVADSATAEQFDQMEAMGTIIHAEHSDAVLELRVHTGKGERCESEAKRFGIKVSLQMGAFKFLREYAVHEDVPAEEVPTE